MKLRLLALAALAMVFVPSASFAFTIKEGTYASDRCRIDVTDIDITDISDGGQYIEISSINGANSLQGDVLVTNMNGGLKDGPGLCLDKVTMGSQVGVEKVVTKLENGSTRVSLKCGGFSSRINVSVEMTINAHGHLVSYVANSALAEVPYIPKRKKTMKCGDLVLVR